MNPVAIDPHRIRDLAYARWQEHGCPQGSAEQDWLEAEQAIVGAQGSSEREAVASGPAVTVSAPTVSAPKLSQKEPAKRAKPPRPTLKRSPNARAAKLLNEVSPKAPTETRAQKMALAAISPPPKRTAVGSG